jgi:hypothetical protein
MRSLASFEVISSILARNFALLPIAIDPGGQLGPFGAVVLECQPVAHPDQLAAEKLGRAENVTDVWMEVGGNKVVKLTGVANPGKTMTVLLRAGTNWP